MRPLYVRLFIASLALLHTAAVESGEVRVDYHLAAPSVKETEAGYSLILFPGAVQAGEAGGPSYPYMGVSILLPRGESLESVSVVRKGWKDISPAVRLHPVQHVRPGSDGGTGRGLLVSEAAYAVDRTIEPPRGTFRTRYMRGHPIATGTISPVSHNPATGRTGYYSEIGIVIRTRPDTRASEAAVLLRTDAATLERLTRVVDNPEAIPSALSEGAGEEPASPAATCCGGTDMLIVTTSLLEPAMEPLKEFYCRRGLITEILTVEEIETGWPGADTQEKIRAAVTDRYINEGLDHLLLAGDCDIGTTADVPCRGLYCAVYSSSVYEDAN
ncbi:MAG TPA: C25 family cysteine peptidase, partial [Candidatus Krumholzibacterium sp.]|nr:C25 family cysteine peptidase [Candidatus Krumholzibacterium sp.]